MAIASLIDNCLMKAPDARPAPDAILSSLRRPLKPQSVAEGRLQAANARAVRGRLERTRKESAKQSEREHKKELYRAAGISFGNITTVLAERIRVSAPPSTMYQDSTIEWSITLETGNSKHCPCFDGGQNSHMGRSRTVNFSIL